MVSEGYRVRVVWCVWKYLAHNNIIKPITRYSHQTHHIHLPPINTLTPRIMLIALTATYSSPNELDPTSIQIISKTTTKLSIVNKTLLDPNDKLLLPAPY
jgi:hypothetical protein